METITEKAQEASIQAGKSVILTYLAPDGLLPQYDGMSAYELSKRVIEASQQAKLDVIGEDMRQAFPDHDDELAEDEEFAPKGYCKKCGEDLQGQDPSICGNCTG